MEYVAEEEIEESDVSDMEVYREGLPLTLSHVKCCRS